MKKSKKRGSVDRSIVPLKGLIMYLLMGNKSLPWNISVEEVDRFLIETLQESIGYANSIFQIKGFYN